MTNGEKLDQVFPDGICPFSKNWLDYEYKEPTTKNDLGVERQIKEICISYPKSNLKEHDGKPYYTIKYVENSKEYQGYGTYKIEVFMEYLKNYFMPSITPQESKSEWQKDHEILKAYSDGANEVLDKIRAEIEQIAKPNKLGGRGNGKSIRYGLCMALEIIDKYKAESEDNR